MDRNPDAPESGATRGEHREIFLNSREHLARLLTIVVIVGGMIAETLRDNVAAIVGAYRKATKTSLTQVSKRFYGNAGFLEAFIKGDQSISIDKLDTMVAAIRAEWPHDAVWPFMRAVVIAQPDPKRREKSNGKTVSDS